MYWRGDKEFLGDADAQDAFENDLCIDDPDDEEMPDLIPVSDPIDDDDYDASLIEFLSSCPTQDREVFKRPERVRAKRAGCWLGNPSKLLQQVCIALKSIVGTEHLMYHLMKEQRLASWSGRLGIDNLPLVKSTIFARSPAVQVLDYYYGEMQKSVRDCLPVLQGVVVFFSLKRGFQIG